MSAIRPVRQPPAQGGTRVVPMFTSFRSSREGPGYTPAVTTAPAHMRRGLLPATGCRPKRGPAYRDSPARTAFESPIHQVRDGSGQARRQTPVPHVSLRESPAGPARSGSTRTSRRCQGRSPPPRQRFPRRDGCPQLHPAAATTEPRGPLTPVRKRSASWRTSMAQWPRAQEATASGWAWSMGREQNRVDHLGGPPPAAAALVDGSGAADPHHLGGAGEVDPRGRLDRFDGAPHPAPVGAVGDGHGRHVLPGQPLQLPLQAGLVVLDGEHVVGAAGDDPLGRAPLGAPWRLRR